MSAQTMKYEEMLTWLLFYTSIFERDEDCRWSSHRSRRASCAARSVEGDDGALPPTLNGAESRRRLPAVSSPRASARASSTSPSRPTISSRPRPAAGARLPAAADLAELLRRPRGAVRARAGARRPLRGDNILYDRDDDGEYFQLYAPTFGEGFFFEIVERRDGYRGYGAANAPFRIAAQRRAV